MLKNVPSVERQAGELPVSRAAAGAVGAPRYNTGKACVNGHFSERKTTNGHCMQCDRDRAKVRLQDPVYRALHRKLTLKSVTKKLADPVKRRAIYDRANEVRNSNPARVAMQAQVDHLRNQREDVKARRRALQKVRYAKVLKDDPKHLADRKIRSALWAKKNKDRANAKTAFRRAMRKRSAPVCLTENDHLEIRLMYAVAQRVSRETGVPHEIDHAIPLKHELVCGLHVPANLQLLSETANRAKANKFIEVNAWQS